MADGFAGDGKSTIWLTRVDRSRPPQTLGLEGADSLRFAADGGLYFRRSEAERSTLWYRSPDGSATRQVLDAPIYDFHGVSPDGEWVLAVLPRGGGQIGLEAFPTAGGPPRAICKACALKWSPGGDFGYLLFPNVLQTVLVSLPSPGGLPIMPEGGATLSELDSLPNLVWRKEGMVYAGPDPATYAYARMDAQRNIFRIPLP